MTTTTTTTIDAAQTRAEQIASVGAMLGEALPTLAEMRAARDFLPISAPARPDGSAADSWLGRIAQAVAYAFRNRDAYDAEVRAEAEAELLADGLARLTLAVEASDLLPAPSDLLDVERADRDRAASGAQTPRTDDPQHSVTAYYGRASNLRRTLDARRRAEKAPAPGADEPVALDSYLPDADDDAGHNVIADDAAEARRAADDLCARLRLDVPVLAYAACRSQTRDARLTAEHRAELGLTPDAARKAAHRERVRVLAEADDAAELVRFLTGGSEARAGHVATGPTGPTWHAAKVGRGTKRDPRTDALLYCTDDRSTEARKRSGRTLARPSREGTASVGTTEDVRPTRAATADDARLLCTTTTGAPLDAAPAQTLDDHYGRTGQAIRNAARYSARH